MRFKRNKCNQIQKNKKNGNSYFLFSHLTTIDLLGQHSNVLDGSAFGDSIEWGIGSERADELHVDDGVGEHGKEAVHDGHQEQELETRHILGGPEPESHVSETQRRLKKTRRGKIEV